MTLGERVEQFAGSVTSQEALSSYLTSALRSIVDLIPDGKLHQHARQVSMNATTGLGASEYRIVSVSRQGYTARWLPQAMLAKVQDINSLYYASDVDPVYYFSDERAFGKPVTGTWTAMVMPYQQVSAGDVRILYFPAEYEHLVVLSASVQALTSKMEAVRLELPDPVDAPSFSFTPVDTEEIPANDAFTIDLTTLFSQLSTYVSTNEDFELAAAKVNEIQARLAEWSKESDTELQRQIFNAKMADDTAKWNALQALQVSMQEYQAQLGHYTSMIGGAVQKMNYLTGQLATVQGQLSAAIQMAFGAKS